MALVPFPTAVATVSRAAAMELLRVELGLGYSDEDKAIALRLGQAAAALVGRYDNNSDSPTPQAILDEAALRVAAWLFDTPKVNVRSVDTGAVKLDYLSKRNALRSSGAMDLLSAWRMHGAGVVSTSE